MSEETMCRLTYRDVIGQGNDIANSILDDVDLDKSFYPNAIVLDLKKHEWIKSQLYCNNIVRLCYENDKSTFEKAEQLFIQEHGGYKKYKSFKAVVKKLAYCILQIHVEKSLTEFMEVEDEMFNKKKEEETR